MPEKGRHLKKKGLVEKYATQEDALRRCKLRCKARFVDEHGHVKDGQEEAYRRCRALCIEAAGKLD